MGDTEGIISDKEVMEVEKKLDVTFPDDYKFCVKENQGGLPSPNAIDIPGWGETFFEYLLGYREDSEVYIIRAYNMIKDRLVDGIVPFAEEPAGNYFCFNFRENEDSPKIVYWDHEIAFNNPEKAIFYVCNTFTDLLNNLHEMEDEEGL